MALDPVLHQPTRLQIMALLYRNGRASFTDVRDGLGLTPGNVASHTTRLQEAGYIDGGKRLRHDGFQVRYRLTPSGAAAFETYVEELRELVRDVGLPDKQ